jgi:hypothetical protein
MQQTAVQVVSIHDQNHSLLAVDLKDVLQALGVAPERWKWCVTLLECTGGEFSQAVCDAVESAGGAGYWLSGQELSRLAEDIRQTLEGEWLAFPADVEPEHLSDEDLHLRCFPTNRVELAILVVDSSFVEVYTKDPALPAGLQKAFLDVRPQDPALYFDEC